MKKYSIVFLITFSLFFNCISKTDNSLLKNDKFKISQFQKDSIEGTKWIQKIYDSINEQDLTYLEYECYRFNYLDSFGQNKFFRVEYYNENRIKLIVKLYNINNEDESYSLTTKKVIDLSKEQYNKFKKLIDGSYFWSLNMFEYPKHQYLDGYSYLLEGFKPKTISEKQRYHMVIREVPNEGSFKQACDKLMEFYELDSIKE